MSDTTPDLAPRRCAAAGCRGCTVYPAGSVDLRDRVREHDALGRDSECPVHGIDADPHWWRTPDHLRTHAFTDAMPPEPTITRAEAERDAWLDEGRPYRGPGAR